jgi:hypothetical protein
MFKIVAVAGAIAAAIAFVSPAPSQASGKSYEQCEARCTGKGLMGKQHLNCTSKCQAGR